MYGRRNPESLFKAIEELIAENKISPEDFTLRFVGRSEMKFQKCSPKQHFQLELSKSATLPIMKA